MDRRSSAAQWHRRIVGRCAWFRITRRSIRASDNAHQPTMGRRQVAPPVAAGERQPDAHQGVVQHTDARCPDAARRRSQRARAHERYSRRALALPCWRAAGGTALYAVTRHRRRARARGTLGACDVSNPDERPPVPRVLFFSCAGGHEALPVGPTNSCRRSCAIACCDAR